MRDDLSVTNRLLSIALLLAACSGKEKDKTDGTDPPPAAAPQATPAGGDPATTGEAPHTVTAPASIDVGKPTTAPPAAAMTTKQKATAQTMGLLHQNRSALEACKSEGMGSTMINLHIAEGGKVTFDLWSKSKVGDDVKQCVGKVLEKVAFPTEKVDLMVDI